ncbi:hypothetical protein [Kitasatospora sp. NPDC098663]|uniref:hypothetical protein n=1 Tax=Kitasatospora sp. NPDC098663 TaxID=3364096 RepID=UPI00381A5826
MADQPIEPTVVELSGERADSAPPAGTPDAFLPPPRRSAPPSPAGPPVAPPPPPAGPPAVPPPPPPSGPPPGAAGLPEPGEWWHRPGGGGGGGGGVATAPAPAYAAAPPVTYVHNHYYPAAPAPTAPAPPRFAISRIRPVATGLALAVGVIVARSLWNPTLHVFGDEPGVLLAGLTGALLLEYRFLGQRVWPVRVLTFSLVSSLALTPAGLHLVGYLTTGV